MDSSTGTGSTIVTRPTRCSRPAPIAAVPIPDLTLVFDRYAETHLREAGHFPAASLAVTGNVRLDQLVAHCDELRPMRDALRREFTLTPDQPLVVLAAKFSEIKDVLPELAEAVRQLPGMRLVIKPHPAETPDVYGAAVGRIANISVAGMDTDLGRLLTAADALVTMNSTVAIDALALAPARARRRLAEQSQPVRAGRRHGRSRRRRCDSAGAGVAPV